MLSWGRRKLEVRSRAAVAGLLALNLVALTIVGDDPAGPKQARGPRTVETYIPEDEPAARTTPGGATAGTGTSAAALPTPAAVDASPSLYSGPFVTVRGRVIDPTGAPVANTPVHLSPHRDDLDVNRIEPVGTACAQPVRAAGCEAAGRGTTNADGTFSLTVLAGLAELQAIEDFDVRVPGTRERAGMIRRIDGITSTTHTVPDLVAWFPGIAVDGADMRWAPPPVEAAIESPSDSVPIPGPDTPAAPIDRFSVLFSRRLATGAADGFYRVAGTEVGAVFEPRALEDESVSAVVEAAHGDVTWISAPVSLHGPGAPLTRHRPCTVMRDELTAVRTYADCPLTDDDDATRIEGGHWMVDVDLGGNKALSLAVVRGYDQPFAVDLAPDPVPNAATPWVMHSGDDPAGSRTRCVHGGATALTDPRIGGVFTASDAQGRFVRLKLDPANKPLSAVDRFSAW